MNEIKLNERTHLLQEEPYSYQLQDVEEPNLMREFFEYTEIPKVSFNFRRSPYNMPENIWITDTTFRDGQQAMAPFTPKQIRDLYQLMHRLGGHLQNDFQTVRAEWNYPADGVFCIQRPGPGGHREVHGPGIEVPGDHHVDSGKEGGL